MKREQRRAAAAVFAMLAIVSAAASAQDESSSGSEGYFSGFFSGMDVSLGGFIRPEISLATGDENPNNQNGNTFNGRAVQRVPGTPVPGVNAISYTIPNPLLADTITRPIDTSNNWSGYHVLRGELELGMKFTNDLGLVARARGVYDPGHYDEFNAASVQGDRGGISGGDPKLYQGRPNYFDYRVEGKSHPNPLEWTSRNYQVYFPSLFLDYNHGPLNLRVGNQQIAWGQAIFFRVFDVVDGLDLRRHSILDYAQEEFSDKRVPALAIRAGYQLTDEVLADAYFQKFQPSIYGNPNTAYNVIPVQFTVHDLYANYDNKFSYGLRMKANYGQWGFQGMAVRRYNPDGVFRWTQTGVNKALPNSNPLGLAENTLHPTGPLLAQTAFEASPGGVYSSEEWFHYAAMVRLDGVAGLNTGVDEFQPATGQLLATHVDSMDAARRELDTFFIAAGGSLRGHIAREYFQENVFGLGASYVTEGEPGGLLDQLIINLETSYTPNRTFTNINLSRDYLRENNSITALVLEKYQRFSNAFPATYFVFQAMHRTKDDLFGRSLKGYGGTDNSVPTGVSGGANYVVFALQQPFPNDIYRAALAVLYDPRGGLLVQPGIKWKPRGSITVEAFYTYINTIYGNPNNNALSTAEFANEATIRLGYQF